MIAIVIVFPTLVLGGWGAPPALATCTWTVVPSPPLTSPTVDALGGSASNDVWGVGTQVLNGLYVPLAEHWDGGSWTVVPVADAGSAVRSLLSASASGPNDVWASGGYALEHWDGTAWTVVPTPGLGANTYLADVSATGPSDAWAVGSTPAGALVGHWDGTAWGVAFSSTDGGLSSVSATGPDDVWAIGYEKAPHESVPYEEHWDGSSWTKVDFPLIDYPTKRNRLADIAALSPSDVWAVGWAKGSGQTDTLVEHWNGSAWSIVDPSTLPNAKLHGVSADSPTDIWAIGIGPHKRLDLLHWNGKRWARTKAPTLSRKAFSDAIFAQSSRDVWAAANSSGDDQPVLLHRC